MNLYDLAYGTALVGSAPVWLAWPAARRRIGRILREQMGEIDPALLPEGSGSRILIHAVSLGELNATRALVDTLRAQRPDLQIVISTTTQTGWARAQELYGNAKRTDDALPPRVIRYPFDLSRAIRRTLDAVRPQMVVLMELEIWPNFIKHCHARGIRVVLVNGRLTDSSYRKYSLVRPLAAKMLRRMSGFCVQDMLYARRFIDLGAPPGRVLVTGTMKFDTAQLGAGAEPVRANGTRELCAKLGLDPDLDRIWVCGSTGPGEEQILLRVYRDLLMRYPRLRLVLVPRHPERFDEVASLIEEHRFPVVRRSQNVPPPTSPPIPPVILGDTMGELRRFYAAAEIVFVGRSLVDLGARQHGSDMIEPAAQARPVVIGPYTGNFAEAVRRFLAANAMVVADDPSALAAAVERLLEHPDEAMAMGRRAMQVVASEQGATSRNADLILALLRRSLDRDSSRSSSPAAALATEQAPTR